MHRAKLRKGTAYELLVKFIQITYCTIYNIIVGKFGGNFNLVVWQIVRTSPYYIKYCQYQNTAILPKFPAIWQLYR